MSCRIAIAIPVFVAVLSAGAQAPAPTVIPNEPICPRCSIMMRPIVTLGTDDGAGSIIGRPMSVSVDSRGRYWVFQELEPPTIYRADGKVDRLLGRKGSGPGEYRSANNGIVIGDSMLVLDWQELRATVVGPDLKPNRFIRLRYGIGDILLLTWPTSIVTVGHMQDSDPPNSTMHILSMADSQTRLVRSFGPRGSGGSMGNVEVNQVIGRARDGLWSAYWNKPQVTLWGRDGVARSAFTRQLDWYTGEKRAGLGSPTTPPNPLTSGILEDEEGLLWLFIQTPAPTWQEGWPARGTRIGGGVEYAMRAMAFDKLFRTYVEVIDPAQKRVLTSKTFDGYIFEALPNRRVALYKVDENGFPRVHIATLQLNRPR